MGQVQRRVVRGTVAGRRGRSIALAALAAALACVSALLVVGAATYLSTVADGAEAAFGGYRYQVTGGGAATQLRMAALASGGDAVGVVTARGSVTARGASAVGNLTELSGPSRYGRLVDGRYPQAPGEASVSRAVAEQTELAVGDMVVLVSDDLDLGGDTYTVTAVTLDPATPGDVSAVAVSRAADVSGRALTWLTDLSPDADPVLAAEVASGNARVGSVDRAISDARRDVGARALSGLGHIETLLFVVALAALGAALQSNRAAGQVVVDAMVASGARRRRAWVIASAGPWFVTTLGTVVGAVAGCALLGLTRGSLGPAVQQEWTSIALQPWTLLAFVFGYTVLAIAGTHLLATRAPRPRPDRTPSTSPRRILILGVALVVTSVVLIHLRIVQVLMYGNVLGMIVGAVGWPLVAVSSPWLRRTPIQARAVRERSAWAVPTLMAVTYVIAITAFQSASLMTSMTSTRDLAATPDTSLVVSSLTANDVDQLRDQFPDIMAGAIVLTPADESVLQPRVTTAADLTCLSAAGATVNGCDPSALDTIAFAPATGPGSELAGRVSEGIVVGADGTVGVAFFTPGTPDASGTTTLHVTGTDGMLGGGLLSALVLRAGDPVAEAAGIEPSVMREVLVPDFATQPAEQRNAFRSTLITRTGYAFLTEQDSTENRQLTAVAATWPGFAAVIAVVALALLTLAALSTQSTLRDVLDQSAASAWQRTRLLLPVVLPFLMVTAGGLLLGRLSAVPQGPTWRGTDLPYDPGMWWLLPAPTALAAAALVLAVAGRRRRSR